MPTKDAITPMAIIRATGCFSRDTRIGLGRALGRVLRDRLPSLTARESIAPPDARDAGTRHLAASAQRRREPQRAISRRYSAKAGLGE